MYVSSCIEEKERKQGSELPAEVSVVCTCDIKKENTKNGHSVNLSTLCLGCGPREGLLVIEYLHCKGARKTETTETAENDKPSGYIIHSTHSKMATL